jgi:hypothetical protein
VRGGIDRGMRNRRLLGKLDLGAKGMDGTHRDVSRSYLAARRRRGFAGEQSSPWTAHL